MSEISTNPKRWSVGLVGYGEVGRILAEDLRKQDVKVTTYDLKLPKDEGFENLAGFMMARLQRLPQKGDSIEFDGRKFSVEEMEGLRVSKVKVEAEEKLVSE